MSANQASFEDDEPPPETPREGWLLVRIHVPELDIYKCLQFPVDKLLWDVKQQVLASLPKVRETILSISLYSQRWKEQHNLIYFLMTSDDDDDVVPIDVCATGEILLR